tara:strand:+ start:478 stop:684 length:207 start_codon:yes stop_codon:yes gene_type:complete
MTNIVKRYAPENYITNRFAIPAFDSINITYDGSDNIATIIYKRDTIVVGQLDYTYDGSNNLTNILRTI